MASRLSQLKGEFQRVRLGVKRRWQRRTLVASLPRGGVGAEVGAWKGDFTAQLLRRTKPARLYLVDPWEYRDDPGYEHAMFGDRTPGGQEKMDAIHDAVCRRFERQIGSGRVVVRRARSTDAAAELEPLDWAYIDGDHTYEAVREDLAAYFPLVKAGGVLAGDDYGMVGWWDDGVRRAVEEFAATNDCELDVLGNQFRIRKPAA
ncbi:MAG TPA: class I SAM-dependent methyltransferase [Solirubrobacteraceae bacterium]|jgi:hypothetical protein|nr:class I SAM-dependent methyltransferase [Solirubrobacteraceae bacterium]